MIFANAFIDFDNTVYESHLLVDYIKDVFLFEGVSEGDFFSTLEVAVHGKDSQYYDYSFELHVALLQEKGYSFDTEKVLLKLHAAFQVNRQAVDADQFLSYLRTRTKNLVLLTAGNSGFQSEKLNSTNLAHFFDEIHIVHGDKQMYVRELNREGDKNIFINDNLKQNIVVKELFPNIIVITRRHPRKYTEQDFIATGIPYFSTLGEIKEYIEKI